MKIQQKIILSIMLGILVGFTAFLSINHEMMEATAKQEVYDKLRDKAKNLTESIEEWIEVKERIARSLSEQVKKLPDKSPENVRRYLYLANGAAKIDASMIYFKGKTLIHTDTNWNLSPEQEEKNIPYQTAKANNFQPSISQVFKSPINKKDNMIAVIYPFNHDSLATLVVEIKDIEEKVLRTKFEGGYAVLVDSNKKILVHPNAQYQGKTLAENKPELQWLEDVSFSKQSGLYEYTMNGEDHIIVFDTIKDTGWKVVISLNKDIAFANVNSQTRKLSIISIIFFICSIFFIIAINSFHVLWRREVEKKKEEYEFILAHRSRMSEIGELISSINHQLNQPLNSLKLLTTSTLSKLKNGTLTNDDLVENLKLSDQTITLMSTTIGMFRNFYRFNDNVNEFSLKQCVESVIQVLSIDFNKHNIGVECHYTLKSDFTVTSIDNFIQQVLLVLLQNAKDALLSTHKKQYSKIQLTVISQDENIIVDVSDWGEGVTKEARAKLFTNIKSSKKALGSGIGLYFARKLSQEKLEGDIILLQSSSPTIFRFIFKTHLVKKEIADASKNTKLT